MQLLCLTDRGSIRLDETTDPPVYRLRHDQEVPNDVSERLIRLWEAAGLPHAGDLIIAEGAYPATY